MKGSFKILKSKITALKVLLSPPAIPRAEFAPFDPTKLPMKVSTMKVNASQPDGTSTAVYFPESHEKNQWGSLWNSGVQLGPG